MPAFNDLLPRNREFAAAVDLTKLAMPTAMPDTLLLILTCADPRVEPADFLGIRTGDAAVLRNAGGRIDDRVIEDVVFLAVRLRVRMEVAIVHHTQCGTGLLAAPTFRQEFANRAGVDPAGLAAKAVTDPARTARQDVDKLLASPLTSPDVLASVSGYALRLETGLVELVVGPLTPAETTRNLARTRT